MGVSTGPCEQSDHVEEYLWFRCEPITDCGQSPVFKSLIRRKWGQEGSEDPFVYQVTDHHEPLDLAQHGGKNAGNGPPWKKKLFWFLMVFRGGKMAPPPENVARNAGSGDPTRRHCMPNHGYFKAECIAFILHTYGYRVY